MSLRLEETCSSGTRGPRRLRGRSQREGMAKPLGSPARLNQEMPTPASQRVGERESGAALILTIIVLTILIVLVVQFAFSVNRESIIVRNTQDDAALELASRGVVPWIRALCQEDRANGAPGGDVDTLGDILFDPGAEEARTVKVGEVDLSFEAEDAERRFPLPWLASGDEKKAEWAKAVLERLIGHLGIEGDAAALTESIVAKIQALSEQSSQQAGTPGQQPAPASGDPATGGTAPAQDQPRRSLYAITQLLEAAAPAGQGLPGQQPAQPSQPPEGEAPAAGDGVSRVVLFGIPGDEEKGIEPVKGLAPYVTTWDTAGINLNTALPEVLWAMLPEKDKTRPEDQAINLWEAADEIVEGIRQFRIDPDHGGGAQPSEPAAEGGEASEAGETGGMGASRSWAGQAFKEVKELENTAVHEKLVAIFTPRTVGGGGGGAPGDPGSGDGPGAGGGTGGGGQAESSGEEEEEGFGLKQALVVKSRIYLVRVEAQLSADVKNVYRMVLTRNDQDDVRAIMIEEVNQ